jgi:hypothetical protein
MQLSLESANLPGGSTERIHRNCAAFVGAWCGCADKD